VSYDAFSLQYASYLAVFVLMCDHALTALCLFLRCGAIFEGTWFVQLFSAGSTHYLVAFLHEVEILANQGECPSGFSFKGTWFARLFSAGSTYYLVALLHEVEIPTNQGEVRATPWGGVPCAAFAPSPCAG